MSIYTKAFNKNDIRWRQKASSKFSRENKSNRTEAESIMKTHLKSHFKGISRVVEQKVLFTPSSFALLDFYLRAFCIGIEIDGGYHKLEEQQLKDIERDNILKKRKHYGKPTSLKIIRFTNDEVINNVDDVLNKIDLFIKGLYDR